MHNCKHYDDERKMKKKKESRKIKSNKKKNNNRCDLCAYVDVTFDYLQNKANEQT